MLIPKRLIFVTTLRVLWTGTERICPQTNAEIINNAARGSHCFSLKYCLFIYILLGTEKRQCDFLARRGKASDHGSIGFDMPILFIVAIPQTG